jgi:hypothetical protein
MLSLAIIVLSLSAVAVLASGVPEPQRKALIKVLQSLACSEQVCTRTVDDTVRDSKFCPSNSGVVRCNNNGDVTGIDMRVCQGTGSLAPEIGSLTDLQFLFVFADNRCTLQGSLPNLATLTQLDNLELQGSFSGALPAFFGASRSLTRLVLTGNNFSSVFQFAQQSKLQELRIENNRNLGGDLGLLPSTLTRLLWLQNSNVTADFSALKTPFAPLGMAEPVKEAACRLSLRFTCGNCTPALLNCECGPKTFCTLSTTTTVSTPPSQTAMTAPAQPAVTPSKSTPMASTKSRPLASSSTQKSGNTSATSSVAVATPMATSTSTSSAVAPISTSASRSDAETGAIVGGALGGFCCLLLAGAVAFVVLRRRSHLRHTETDRVTPESNYGSAFSQFTSCVSV